MKRSLPLAAALLAAILLLRASTGHCGRIYVDITSPELRKIPIAVPYFLDTGRPGPALDPGKEMSAWLDRALTFHGFIAVLDPKTYGGVQDAAWKDLKMDFTILGSYDLEGSIISMEMRLLDLRNEEPSMLLGRRYRGEWAQRQTMIRRFCDEVILQLTGERGVSLTRIAFVSDHTGNKEVFLADVLGDSVRQVTAHHSITASPRFAPDGRRLAYVSLHRDNPNLYITDLSQDKYTKAISTQKGLNMAAAWSPDGGSLAITLSVDGNPDLYLIGLDGRVQRRLTSGAGINVSPSWSPDGKRIAFCSDRAGNPQIFVMDVASGAVQRLTYEGRYNTAPAWSPDGKWIAFTGQVERFHNLFLVSPDGGAPTQLTPGGADHEAPSWSPDSRQIVFTRGNGRKSDICTIFSQGGAIRTLLPMAGNQSSPQWSPRLEE
ncbi:MAG: protein TolB [Thermodesulfobacteriota bacterium]